MGSQERKIDQRVIRQFAFSLFGNIVCMKDQKYMIMNTKDTNDHYDTATRSKE